MKVRLVRFSGAGCVSRLEGREFALSRDDIAWHVCKTVPLRQVIYYDGRVYETGTARVTLMCGAAHVAVIL